VLKILPVLLWKGIAYAGISSPAQPIKKIVKIFFLPFVTCAAAK
jgi:hypothetical protein